jgi:hypothetical protein
MPAALGFWPAWAVLGRFERLGASAGRGKRYSALGAALARGLSGSMVRRSVVYAVPKQGRERDAEDRAPNQHDAGTDA